MNVFATTFENLLQKMEEFGESSIQKCGILKSCRRLLRPATVDLDIIS